MYEEASSGHTSFVIVSTVYSQVLCRFFFKIVFAILYAVVTIYSTLLFSQIIFS